MKTRSRRRPTNHVYSSDRPIRTHKEDLLDRSDFAIRLADDIKGWTGRDSLVVALYGRWGCGKTSLKNLILAHLEKGRAKMPIVEFNPWQFSGTGSIASAFFGELGIALGKSDDSADASDRAERLKRYAGRLSVGGTTVEKIGNALALLGIPGSEYIKIAGKGIKQIGSVTEEGSAALLAKFANGSQHRATPRKARLGHSRL